MEQERANQTPILEVNNIRKWFPVKSDVFGGNKGFVKAVDDINFKLYPGDTLGIVGESGCGKSTLARTVMRLIDATEGEIYFEGEDITKLSQEKLKAVRRNLQIIFQDPFASLNPRMRVRDILSEPMLIHKLGTKKEAMERAKELITLVGLNQDSLGKYPHEFSGGQRQRICIARALAVSPKVLVCDECVSALDVSIQAQIINLLKDLQQKLGLTLIFVSHDLRVVRHISTHVAVMYLGKIVEFAPKCVLFETPTHPYTQALLSAVPVANPDKVRNRIVLTGDIPSPINVPSGCSFHTRCPQVGEQCSCDSPQLLEIAPGHFCRCPRGEAALK